MQVTSNKPRIRLARKYAPLPDYKVYVTPPDEPGQPDLIRVLDLRNGAEVPHEAYTLRNQTEPGRPISEWWADITIRGARMRLPVEFSAHAVRNPGKPSH